MIEKLGVIDVGTNTFHLLIVEWNANSQNFVELVRKRVFVKLGIQGLNHIQEEAYQFGIKTMQEFEGLLKQNTCFRIKAYGTSAMRNADNADQFIKEVERTSGIKIEKISGEKEATLILNGVRLSIPFNDQASLVMDIGGGSVEFIIATKNQMLYSHSFKVGVAVLKNLFHQSEPISDSKIQKLQSFLEDELKPFVTILKEIKPRTLIGASGTFDVLEQVLPKDRISQSAVKLDTNLLRAFTGKVISKNLEERYLLEEIPHSRADLIVVALILIDFVWNSIAFDQLLVTTYSMKEGMIHEMVSADS